MKKLNLVLAILIFVASQLFTTHILAQGGCHLILEKKTNITCNGSDNGYLRVNTAGCTGPPSYSWSNGASTRAINNLSAGTYSVTVNGVNPVLVGIYTISEPIKLILKTNINKPSCFGGSNGSINLSVTGGTPSYTYKWSNGSTNKTISFLKAGTYKVTVTDKNNCKKIGSYIVSNPPKLIVQTVYEYDVTCKGANDGAVKVNGQGGKSGYTYNWSNGVKSSKINNLKPGTYTVTVTDANTCKKTKTYNITEPSLLTVSTIAQSNVKCNGGNDGDVEVKGNGGTTNYTYNWSNGKKTAKIINLKAGTYKVTVTDKNKCTATKTFTITQPTKLSINTIAQSNVKCNGGNDGNVEVKGNGGTTNYTYNWSNGKKTAKISNLKAGTYKVTVTDKNKCTATKNFTITQPIKLEISNTKVINNLCNGQDNASIELTISGGIKAYTYSWSNGAKTAKIINLKANDYLVTITDKNLCKINEKIIIKDPLKLLVEDLSKTNVKCKGGNSGEINIKGKGGILPYSYSWSNGSKNAKNIMLKKGVYKLTLTDKNNCLTQATYNISEPSKIEVVLDKLKHNNCGAKKIGSIETHANGGIKPYKYLWSNKQTSKDLFNLNKGVYSVTIKDKNECSTIKSFTVTETDSLKTDHETIVNIQCFDQQNGSIAIQLSGGEAPYEYHWSNGGTKSSINNLSKGTYSCTAYDTKGCAFKAKYIIKEPLPITTNKVIIDSLQCNGDSSGQVSLNIKGGNNPFAIEWTYAPNDTSQFAFIIKKYGIQNDTLDSIDAGIIKVIISDNNNCSIEDTFQVFQPEILTYSLVDIKPSSNKNGAIDIDLYGGTFPYTYSWLGPNGYTNKIEDIKDLDSGDYWCSILDKNNCTLLTDTIVVHTTVSSINSQEPPSKVKVYPIPLIDNLHIDFDTKSKQYRIIQLFTFDGKIIQSMTTYSITNILDLTNVSGNYFVLRIFENDHWSYTQIIKN